MRNLRQHVGDDSIASQAAQVLAPIPTALGGAAAQAVDSLGGSSDTSGTSNSAVDQLNNSLQGALSNLNNTSNQNLANANAQAQQTANSTVTTVAVIAGFSVLAFFLVRRFG